MVLEDHTEKVVGLALEPVGAAPDGHDGRNAGFVGRDVRLDDHLVASLEGEEVVVDLYALDVVDGGDAAEVVEVEGGMFPGDAADFGHLLGFDGDGDLVDGRSDLHGNVSVDGGQRSGERLSQAVEAGGRLRGRAAASARGSCGPSILLRQRTWRPV